MILTNIQSEIIDKSTISSTRRWTNGLGTAHSKMGGPTFVNENVVHKLDTLWKKSATDYHYRHLNWFLQISNLLIDKSTIISTRRWTNGLGTAHSKILLSMKKWLTNSKKKCSAELWKKSAKDYHYRHLNWFLQISNLRSLTKAPLFPLEDRQTVLAQPTQRWVALLLSMKKWFTNSTKKMCKSATDYHYRHLNWFLQISNLRSLTKAPLFPLEDGQTVLAQPTQRWAALLLSMKMWFTNSKKK